MANIKEELEKLNREKIYPFHMPGHKRSKDAGKMASYYNLDITEIDGYDNLHDAEGIILEAEKRANKLYRADETHFLVNGSTCGILAAVSCCVPRGGKLLAGRNSHKALYHAAYLRNIDLVYLMPSRREINIETTTIFGAITPKSVEDSLKSNEGIKAVFITSPTYEGFSSDISEIAEIAHKYGAVLIVDAAHGAHFGLDERLPKSGIELGADIVIHSVHKTLASMTQTALIHVKSERVNCDLLRRYLHIYQSSSPSYILMSSIDSCMEDIEENGDEVFSRLIYYREKIEKETAGCKNIRVYGLLEGDDPGKLLIYSATRGVTGQKIYDILRLEYKLQMEMAAEGYTLAIITGYDSEEGIDRLIQAICKIDKDIESFMAPENIEDIRDDDFSIPQKVLSLTDAWDADVELVDIKDAAGRISADFVNLYPPGIPLIAPGEKFSNNLILKIERCINAGINVQGLEKKEKDGTCYVKLVKADFGV